MVLFKAFVHPKRNDPREAKTPMRNLIIDQSEYGYQCGILSLAWYHGGVTRMAMFVRLV